MDLEVELDRFLKIKTNGRDDSNSNYLNYAYEATPYVVLQNLANSGYITKKDKIIDYGCGKGRVSLYLSYSTKAKTIGVEYDERLFNSAQENLKRCICNNRTEFFNSNAMDFEIPTDVTGLYFFNPFSVEVLDEVFQKVKKSLLENKREMKLFFYYISNDYLNYLNNNEIVLLDEIDCSDYFKENCERECVKIYSVE